MKGDFSDLVETFQGGAARHFQTQDQRIKELEDALENIIDSCVTDSDTCVICLQYVTEHIDGCAVPCAIKARSRKA
jgi:hypothetical protein